MAYSNTMCSSLMKSYHDKLIQHWHIFQLSVTVQQKSGMICIGQSLFVKSLPRKPWEWDMVREITKV